MGIVAELGMKWKDLCPINQWEVDQNGPNYKNENCSQYIIDKTSKKRYLNDTDKSIRIKCALAATLGLVPQTVALVTGTLFRLIIHLRSVCFGATVI